MHSAAIVANNLRALTIDELDQVSGGKGKKVEFIVVERCTTTIGKDGKESQSCTTTHTIIP
jgi:hypothetical protein